MFTALSTALAASIVIQTRSSLNRWQWREITGGWDFRTGRENILSSSSVWRTECYLDWMIWKLRESRVSNTKNLERRLPITLRNLRQLIARRYTAVPYMMYLYSIGASISTYLFLKGSRTPFLVLKSMTLKRRYFIIKARCLFLKTISNGFDARIKFHNPQNEPKLDVLSCLFWHCTGRGWFRAPERLRNMEERTSLMSLAHFGLVNLW